MENEMEGGNFYLGWLACCKGFVCFIFYFLGEKEVKTFLMLETPVYLQKQPFLWALKNLKSRFWAIFCAIFTKIELESALGVGIRQTFFSRRSEYFSELEKNVVDYHKNFFSANFLC